MGPVTRRLANKEQLNDEVVFEGFSLGYRSRKPKKVVDLSNREIKEEIIDLITEQPQERIEDPSDQQPTPNKEEKQGGALVWDDFQNSQVGFHFTRSRSTGVKRVKVKTSELKKPKKDAFGPCPCHRSQSAVRTRSSAFRIATNCSLCCKFCGFWSRCAEKLKKHKDDNHRFRCEECTLTFDSKDDSELHFYRKHQVQSYCSSCQRVYKSQSHFNAHTHTKIHKTHCEAEERGAYYLKTRFNIALPAIGAPMDFTKVPEVLKKHNDGSGLQFHGSALIDKLQKAEGAAFVGDITTIGPKIMTKFGTPFVTPGRQTLNFHSARGRIATPKSKKAKKANNSSWNGIPMNHFEETSRLILENYPAVMSPRSRPIMEALISGSSSETNPVIISSLPDGAPEGPASKTPDCFLRMAPAPNGGIVTEGYAEGEYQPNWNNNLPPEELMGQTGQCLMSDGEMDFGTFYGDRAVAPFEEEGAAVPSEFGSQIPSDDLNCAFGKIFGGVDQ